MKKITEIIINKTNYSQLNSIISELLSIEDIQKSIRKKITVCILEIVQNNCIHNDNEDLIIQILKNKTIKIVFTHKFSIENYLKLKNHIQKINSFSIEELKDIKIQNIISQTKKKSTGNGLIICRIKSGNPIILEELNEESDIIKSSLILVFNYDNNI